MTRCLRNDCTHSSPLPGATGSEFATPRPTHTLVQRTICQENGLEHVGSEEIRVVSIENILRHHENLEIRLTPKGNRRLLLLPLFVLALRIRKERRSDLQVGDHRFNRFLSVEDHPLVQEVQREVERTATMKGNQPKRTFRSPSLRRQFRTAQIETSNCSWDSWACGYEGLDSQGS